MDTSSRQQTRDQACPYCGSGSVVGLGRVMANATGIRCDYRCAECLEVFVLLSGEVAEE
jgi:transposase-like protein